jgi:hypothetical protein
MRRGAINISFKKLGSYKILLTQDFGREQNFWTDLRKYPGKRALKTTQDDQIKEDEMAQACSRHGGDEKLVQYFSRNI